MIEACEVCRQYETSPQKETLMSHELATRPWEKIGVDIFDFDDENFLITVDYFSNYWEVDKLISLTSAQVILILKLKSHFARFGIPDKLVSDNGTQFSSTEFASFSKKWEFEHLTSSPHNSKANGKVESAVKTAKRILRKCLASGIDPYLGILEYRNTPTQGISSSPVQRLMNRRTKTLIPTADSLLQPKLVDKEATLRAQAHSQENQARYYNTNAKDLAPLEEGDVVRMKPF